MKKIYNFGEKTTEKVKNGNEWVNMEVYQTPKYLQSKTKAIEIIEKGNYEVEEGDFWILMNKGGSKMCYTGLILSHNGCLKINDKLKAEEKFKPECADIYKDDGGNIVMRYVCAEQGLYEFGEISPKNCKNEYPYAMALKRLQDRVILKNSKIAFFGIYSDSESEDFKEDPEKKLPPKELESPHAKLKGIADDEEMARLKAQKKESDAAAKRKAAEDFFARIKKEIEACKTIADISAVKATHEKMIKALEKYPDLSKLLEEAVDAIVDAIVDDSDDGLPM